MRIACAPVIAGLLLGCTPNASTQPPEGEATAPTASETPTSEAPAPDEDVEPAPAAAAGISTSTLTASGDPGGTAGGSGDPTAGGEPEPEPEPEPETSKPEPSKPETRKPAVTTLELPKPLHGDLDASCGKDPGVGERLKSFSLPGIEGKDPVTTGSFRGRVLVVNFWGTWCKPCLKELPEFDQLYRRYRKHGMTLLAIATDEDAKAVKDLLAEKKIGAKVAIAGEAYAGQYGSPKFPFTFVVDHKGVIQASYRGYKPECTGQLEADIREQLKVRAEAKAQRGKG